MAASHRTSRGRVTSSRSRRKAGRRSRSAASPAASQSSTVSTDSAIPNDSLPGWRTPSGGRGKSRKPPSPHAAKTKQWIVRLLLPGGLLAAGWFLYFTFRDLPDLDTLTDHLNQPSIRITDRNGRLLYDILPAEGGRHSVLSFEAFPDCMKQATIAVEDRNYYNNPGVDPEGILRAFWINLQGGETIAGGSTITQQVVRDLLMSWEERTKRSLNRKLREAYLAWQMTNRYSKDEILAFYLNQTYYGGLAYGVEAAAQTYFGKHAAELILPECALLAGLPQAPGLYNPFTRPDLARERRDTILGLMEKASYINAEERTEAETAPIILNPAPYPMLAPHFLWLVKDRLDQLAAHGAINPRQSLVVRTTLDLDQQQLAEQAVERQLRSFREESTEFERNVNNAALVSLDPRNGEILALVGSADYFQPSISGAVNMAVAPRQPGSAFKPFLYAQALDPLRDDPWTAASVLFDISTTFVTHDNLPYTPVDYDQRERGPVSVRTALSSSLNIPAVLTLDEVGIDSTLALARKLGITSLGDPGEYDLSLALGGGQMSLLALTTAYGALANNGFFLGNTCLIDIHDADGKMVYREPAAIQEHVFDPRVAWLISDILSDDRARSIGFGRNSTLKLDRTAAVKTGTTTNFHDNWTVGYTPSLVVGVWVGNSDYKAMRAVNGLTGAAPIWNEFLRAVLQGKPDEPFPRPEGMHTLEVCALSGLLPTPACTDTQIEWFIDGTQPTEFDGTCHVVVVDILTDGLADSNTPPDRRRTLTVFNLPLSAHAWARAQGWPLLDDFTAGGDPLQPSASELLLLSPQPFAEYRLDAGINPSAQQLLVEAVAGRDIVQVSFYIDGRILAILANPPFQTWWPLAAGEHLFWAVGHKSDGSTVTTPSVTITVQVDE
jgi:penicillin-binding protein 1C